VAIAVPFGQYVSGTTVVHRLDCRIKLLLVAVYVFALFASNGWIGLLVCSGLLVAAYVIGHISGRLAIRGLKPVWLILTFTFLANALTFQADFDSLNIVDIVNSANSTDLVNAINAASTTSTTSTTSATSTIALIGNFGIKPLGAIQGLYFVLRITLLVSMTSLLTYTSSVVSLADAITSMLAPLRRVKVPVEDVAMMFTIALRFIPLTAEEAEKLIVAQTARGVKFDQGGPIKRIRAYIPVMIPLFVNLFRRADQLAQAMESRCYQGKGRTQMGQITLTPQDISIGIIGTILLLTIGIVL
jgi:energy-coupling factor transport system permease protein